MKTCFAKWLVISVLFGLVLLASALSVAGANVVNSTNLLNHTEQARTPDQCPRKTCAPKRMVQVQINPRMQLARTPDQCPPKVKTCSPNKGIVV